WLTKQLVDKLVEPNSGLGRAITYFLKRWEPLTLFLRQAGDPLDNNITERALKKAIQHRKNSLFFKTMNGARVGDTFMSLIHTCELSGANPFDYLTELLRHRNELKRAPQDWMPWNYRQAIDPARRAAESSRPGYWLPIMPSGRLKCGAVSIGWSSVTVLDCFMRVSV